MKKQIFIYFIVSCLIPFFLNAGLTIDECMNLALQNNRDLLKTEKGKEAAKEKKFQGITSFLPVFSLNGIYTRLSEEPPKLDFTSLMRPGAAFPDITGNPLTQYAGKDNFNANFRVTQPLFMGGRNMYQYKAGIFEYNAREAESRYIKNKLKVDVIKAFYGILLSQEMKTLAETATNTLKNHLKNIDSLMKNGAATEYDFLKTEAKFLSWQAGVTKAERDLKNASKQLKYLIGMTVYSNIAIEGELTYKDYTNTFTLEEAKTTRGPHRPEIIMNKEINKINDNIIGMKKSTYYPQVNFQYNYYFLNKQEDFTLESRAWRNWWDIRLILSWEFFSFGRNASEVKENKLKAEQAELELKSLGERIKMEIEDAFERRTAAKEDITVWQKNRDVANRSYEIVNENYKNGTMLLTDVMDAQLALIDAKVQYNKALYDYKIACAEFNRIMVIEE